MNSRITIIDIAKGISIILVAFCHSKLKPLYPEINQAMGLFRIPLFFFLSGVFFKVSSKPTAFILSKTDALLKPYFVTFFIFLMIPIVSSGWDTDWLAWIDWIGERVEGILYGNGVTIKWPWTPLWFLTHLWCLFIVSYLLLSYSKLADRSNALKIFVVVSLIVIGSYFIDAFWQLRVKVYGNEYELPGLPFSLDIIFISMAFFISGHFLKQWIIDFKPRLDILMGVIFVFIVIATNSKARIDLNSRIYEGPLLATMAAISGIYFVLSFSYFSCQNKLLTKLFTTFGTASLFILIFHEVINIRAYHALSRLSFFDSELILAAVTFIISIVAPLLIRKFIMIHEFFMLFYFPLKTNGLLHGMSRKTEKKIIPKLHSNY